MLHFLSSYCSDTEFTTEKNDDPKEAARAAINWSTPSIFSFLECPSQSPDLDPILYYLLSKKATSITHTQKKTIFIAKHLKTHLKNEQL